MAEIAFILGEATFLRYFVPLARRASSRGHNVTFYGYASKKYTNCLSPPATFNHIKSVIHEAGGKFKTIDEFKDSDDTIVFVIEGVGIEFLNSKKSKIVSMTYMIDYADLYDKYIDKVDNVVFPSLSMASSYDKISDKNLYLGCTKFDYERDPLTFKKSVNKCQKTEYKKDQKYALIMYPTYDDLRKIPLDSVIKDLKISGYIPIVKYRAKAPVRGELDCLTFCDYTWFPHPTIEAISACDVVVNSGSSVIKECVMGDTPVINFDVKSSLSLPFLYDTKITRSLSRYDPDIFVNYLKELADNSLSKDFRSVRNEHLFELGSSDRILNEVLR